MQSSVAEKRLALQDHVMILLKKELMSLSLNAKPFSDKTAGLTHWLLRKSSSAISRKSNLKMNAGARKKQGLFRAIASAFENSLFVTTPGETQLTGPLISSCSIRNSIMEHRSSREIHDMNWLPSPKTDPSPRENGKDSFAIMPPSLPKTCPNLM
jgi:hypothetical protein